MQKSHNKRLCGQHPYYSLKLIVCNTSCVNISDVLMMKRKIYEWLIKGVIFLLFLLSIAYLFRKKYVEEGECVAILYYLPLSVKDYFAIIISACSAFGLSYLLTKGNINNRVLMLEALIYTILVVMLCIYGNNILASVEVNWPHTYHPKPYLQ